MKNIREKRFGKEEEKKRKRKRKKKNSTLPSWWAQASKY